ncbi:hypothetical protein [Flavobacterium sp.]|uniref:hypothetical protein n=1 Tax=Flavobacterium sp. TaxID=239 RepID=UPI00375005F6
MKNNMHNIIDLKLSLIVSMYTLIAFSEAEKMMKIIAFVLTVGYTIHRWIHLIKNKNDK